MKKMLHFNDWPMAIKLLVVMVLIVLVPLTIVGFLNANNTANSLEKVIGNAFEDEARDVNEVISTYLEERVQLLESLSLNNQIRNALQVRNTGYRGSEEEILEELLALDEAWRNGSETTPFIARTLSTEPGINPVTPVLHDFASIFVDNIEVLITDIRGGTVGATNRLPNYYHANEEWWRKVYRNGQGTAYISDPEFDESANTLTILVAVPIFSEGDQGEILGIARSRLNIDSLAEEIREVSAGETGRAQLLDKRGNIILDPKVEEMIPLPPATIAQFVSQQQVVALDEEGDLSIFGYAHLARLGEGSIVVSELTPRQLHIREAFDNLGWQVVVRQKASEALEPVAFANRLAILTSVAAVLLAGLVAFAISRLLTRQVIHIQDLFGEIGIGNLAARAEVISGDELGQMAANLNTMLDNLVNLVQTQEERNRIQAAIKKLLNEVAGVADGDLTVEADVTGEMTGAIADSFNLMITQLREIIANVQQATVQVSTSANEIRTNTEFLSQGSETQATQIADAATAVDEMSISIQQVSENAVLSTTIAEQALLNARQGAASVRDSIDSMDRIQMQVQQAAEQIVYLGQSSEEIGQTVKLIRDIADRTSLVALNASIQAAKAGEAGRGFAVVARDVERLAEQSSEAAQQISRLIGTIQESIAEAVTVIKKSTHEVELGWQLVGQAGESLKEIEIVSGQLAAVVQSISNAAKQQARGTEAVAFSMSDIAEVTQQTAVGTRQAASSISNLAVLADSLRNSVSAFKLPSNNGFMG